MLGFGDTVKHHTFFLLQLCAYVSYYCHFMIKGDGTWEIKSFACSFTLSQMHSEDLRICFLCPSKSLFFPLHHPIDLFLKWFS